MDTFDNNLNKLIAMMIVEMDRMPTEEEVMGFIYGTAEERLEILNTTTKE